MFDKSEPILAVIVPDAVAPHVTAQVYVPAVDVVALKVNDPL